MILLDGGTGSELARRGVPVDPVMWHALAGIEHFATLRDVHRDFLVAGADIITANTFATHRFVLEAAGHGRDFERLAAATIHAAQEARAEFSRLAERRGAGARQPPRIAGSISCLPPGFDPHSYPPPAAAAAAYLEQARTLAALGIDLLLVEMMQDTRHARWAVEAALSTGLPVWVGVSCRRDPAGRLIGYDFPGIRTETVLAALAQYPVAGFSVMHTPLADIPIALDLLAEYWRGPLAAAPEVGCFDPATRTRSAQQTPAALAQAATGWRQPAMAMIGACCGAGPEHTAALRAAIPQAGSGIDSPRAGTS